MTNDYFRMIDPACGSGHFLLGSFARLLERWQKKEPGTNARELAQRALDSIFGVDLNPYAVAVARFRLLMAAMRACGLGLLKEGGGFRLHLACGDSLLHGGGAHAGFGWHEFDHVYQAEDSEELRRILKPGHYHAVVANPPYITPKDKAQNDAYRERYSTCHMKYSLAVPFMQRLFQLAIDGYRDAGQQGGFVGQITANSFMKREFGKKLIEQFLAGREGAPGVDLTHVIDTSGAYIPGHGTPTVILFGRNRGAVAKTIRTVMGIRGEPSTPEDPARGLVWSAIVRQIDQPGSQSEFVTVADTPREHFHKHPWSLGGGGAAELKALIDGTSGTKLGSLVHSIGFASFPGLDDAFVMNSSTLGRRRVPARLVKVFLHGERVRDWGTSSDLCALAPYDESFDPVQLECRAPWARHLWPFRCCLASVVSFGGKTRADLGERWWTWYRWIPQKYRVRLSIVFASVGTHNHFAIERPGKVFNRHAPVIKLPPEAAEDEHLGLVGLLNSSAGCFWMKEVFHDKGSTVDSHGARQTTVPFENFREFAGTGLLKFPLPEGRPLALAKRLDTLAQRLCAVSPESAARCGAVELCWGRLAERRKEWESIRGQMIALQEELDWECYRLYGLLEENLVLSAWCLAEHDATAPPATTATPSRKTQDPHAPPIELGQRAFEIVLARKMAAGEAQTTWFARHGSTPITEIPADWPDDYRRLVERRIELIETDRNIGLIEQPEYKRRWNTEPWESQLDRTLRNWLLDRLERQFDFDGRMNEEGKPTAQLDVAIVSTAKLADVARQDTDFMQVGELYRDDPAFDVQRLVDELVEEEIVPLLPVLRYKATGLRKRAEWEKTWELQREEDKQSAVSSQQSAGPEKLTADSRSLIAPPPKYKSSDFQKSSYWRLRGKLDVPKERWVSFPHCEGEDGTPVIAWAGYDHLQLARAVSAYYVDIQERLGGRDDPRLLPLLACLIELLPWLKQWHNEIDPEFGMAMGDYFEGFIQEEARQMGKTVEEVRAWQPPKKAGRRKKKTASKQ